MKTSKALTSRRGSFRELLYYIIPGIMGLLFNSFYIVVDGLLVARILGRNPLAAVTVAVPVIEIMIAISMLISVGSGVIISNYYGEKKTKEAREIFNISVRLLLIVSITMAILSIFFLDKIVALLGATDEIFNLTKEYLKYLFLFAPSFMFSYGLGTWVRNDGNPKLVMVSQIIGALVNIVLDYVFMKHMSMGIGGASIATGLGPIAGIILMLPYIIRRKGHLYFDKVSMTKTKIIDILKKGIPSFSMEFALGLTSLCMNLVIEKYMGSLGLAAYGIIVYMALILYSIFLGMAEGSQPLLSFFHGAKNQDKKSELLKISLVLAFSIGILSYIALRLFGTNVIKVFGGDDLDLIQEAKSAMNLYFLGLSLTGINIIVSSYYQSVARWKESVSISLMRSLLILLPVLVILGRYFPVTSIWLGVGLTELLTLLISIFVVVPISRNKNKKI